MAKKASLSATITTRDRILLAAMVRFSRQSYDETRLRDIAADVGVDAAYVHRLFGSKRQLFAEVIGRAVEADAFLDEISTDLVGVLTHRAVTPENSGRGHDVDPLDIAVHSISSVEAAEVHRDFLNRDVIEPLALQLKAPGPHRAALIAAFLTGLNILRNVIGIKELQGAERSALDPLIRSAFEVLVNEPVAARPKTKSEGSRRR